MKAKRTSKKPAPLSTDANGHPHNPLQKGEAGLLARCITGNFLDDPDDIARLLLLAYAFTYEREMLARESLLCEVEAAVLPLLNGTDELIQSEIDRVLVSSRERRAREKGGADE